MKVKAPWTREQVESLLRWQNEDQFHPYTCPEPQHIGEALLVPTRAGWFCGSGLCNYTQDWAHDFSLSMAAPLDDSLGRNLGEGESTQ